MGDHRAMMGTLMFSWETTIRFIYVIIKDLQADLQNVTNSPNAMVEIFWAA